MKKNLMSVLILALVVVNLVLTAILTITVLPQAKKSNELVEKVCSAIDLELQSGEMKNASSVPMDKLATYDLADSLTINLKDSKDGSSHYAVIAVTLSMNTESDGYKTYGEKLDEKASLIASEINNIVGKYTIEEMKADQESVQEEIQADLQKLFDSDFIVGVGFKQVTYQ